MDKKVIERLELNKILAGVAAFAVLPQTKSKIAGEIPLTERAEVEKLLQLTGEADRALFQHGVGRIESFPEFDGELERAQVGASLSCKELLGVAQLLRSARIAYRGISALEDCPQLKDIVSGIYFDELLEQDIGTKIVSEDELSDYASDELYSIRRSIRLLNERIRTKLSEYLSGENAKYLQEGIVTMRDNRYVLPVRAEYKARVRGFVHDRSASGATFFIEPEQVLEMNNELRELHSAEKEEIERILAQLSHRVGGMALQLSEDVERLIELDRCYAKAEFSYKNRCVRPAVKDSGEVIIYKGRHPLLDGKTVVPVSIELGKAYKFLLITGPNTGGKTVTLKMCGLFCLMACCGIFIPAAEGSVVSVFRQVFCDIGDAQSIEENLSTFSSHIKNIIEITQGADARSLVLIDELGGGTDPDEGQALAKAIIEYLLSKGCCGIVTTHYTALKEFAYEHAGIENASMEFDNDTLQPLYRVSLGMPGSSNAIAISRKLGLPEEILENALSNLSEGGRRFENILRNAEQSRLAAEEARKQSEALKAEWASKLAQVESERERLQREREKLHLNARIESRRIINERTSQAEELLNELEEIVRSKQVSEADLIRARTLKNKLSDKAYSSEEEEEAPLSELADFACLKAGSRVYVGAMQSAGEVLSVNAKKQEAEVSVNGMRVKAKAKDLYRVSSKDGKAKQAQEKVQVVRKITPLREVKTEINLLGLTVSEAVQEVDAFIDQAVLGGLSEVKIIHGMGTGKLKEGIRNHLRGMKNVAEFRSGAYGEGESGVTIVKLK